MTTQRASSTRPTSLIVVSHGDILPSRVFGRWGEVQFLGPVTDTLDLGWASVVVATFWTVRLERDEVSTTECRAMG